MICGAGERDNVKNVFFTFCFPVPSFVIPVYSFLFSPHLRCSRAGVSPGGKRPSVRQRRAGGRSAVCPSKSVATYVTGLHASIRKKVSLVKITVTTCLVSLFVFSFSEEVTYRWIYNEFPVFLHTDRRRFVSQKTGNLYISKVEAQDAGNYSCFVSSPVIGKSVFSKFIPLIPLPPDDG